jgi:tryptophan synthase beta chain
MVGVEPAGKGLDTPDHAATLTKGRPGILHGFKSYLIQDGQGKALPVYSIATGLDYPGVGPEHAFYKDSGRAEYITVSDPEAVEAFLKLSKLEGMIPAVESSHAISYGMKLAARLAKEQIMIINLSGRGDQDVAEIARILQK